MGIPGTLSRPSFSVNLGLETSITLRFDWPGLDTPSYMALYDI